jgi:hypothetical protein
VGGSSVVGRGLVLLRIVDVFVIVDDVDGVMNNSCFVWHVQERGEVRTGFFLGGGGKPEGERPL